MSIDEDVVITEFREAMRAKGIDVVGDIIPNTQTIQRIHLSGDKPGSLNGSYKLHIDDHSKGIFWNWKTGEKHVWASANERTMTPAERREWSSHLADLRREREGDTSRREAEAQKRAHEIWERAWPAPADHPYLLAKEVGPHGLRLYDGALVVPLRDFNGELHSLHFIAADGKKRFLKHGRVEGMFHTVGDATGKRVWVAEGYATGATIHELTGERCLVACNAGNLMAVAKVIYLGDEVVIAADYDAWTKGNPGLNKALDAAHAVDGKVAVPLFPDISMRPTDWNDQMRIDGKELTRRTLQSCTMTPERYVEKNRERDKAWERYALEVGWSRSVVDHGLAQRRAERGHEHAR